MSGIHGINTASPRAQLVNTIHNISVENFHSQCDGIIEFGGLTFRSNSTGAPTLRRSFEGWEARRLRVLRNSTRWWIASSVWTSESTDLYSISVPLNDLSKEGIINGDSLVGLRDQKRTLAHSLYGLVLNIS